MQILKIIAGKDISSTASPASQHTEAHQHSEVSNTREFQSVTNTEYHRPISDLHRGEGNLSRNTEKTHCR